jgi:hypothetical protein
MHILRHGCCRCCCQACGSSCTVSACSAAPLHSTDASLLRSAENAQLLVMNLAGVAAGPSSAATQCSCHTTRTADSSCQRMVRAEHQR